MADTVESLRAELDALKAKVFTQHPDEACPELACNPFDEVTVGKNIIASDPESNCPKALKNKDFRSIPVTQGSTVENHAGTPTDPIVLDGLQPSSGGFKRIVIQQQDGTVKHWVPKNDGNQYKLITTGDTIKETLDQFTNDIGINVISEVTCCDDLRYVIGAVNSGTGDNIRLVKLRTEILLDCFCEHCGGLYDPIYDIA